MKFSLALTGFLAPGSMHARPSAQAPIIMSGNFRVHMSVPLNISCSSWMVVSKVQESNDKILKYSSLSTLIIT